MHREIGSPVSAPVALAESMSKSGSDISGNGRSGWEISKDWWSEAAEDGSIIADTRQYSLHPCQADIKILSRVE